MILASEYIIQVIKMKEKLVAMLKEIRPDVDFEKEKALIDSDILDSFDIISIVQAIDDNFGVAIDADDLEPSNFNSYEAMLELIKKRKA